MQAANIIHTENNLGQILFLKALINQREMMKAIIIPINGAKKINATICNTGAAFIELSPAWAIAAPANPPINVCDEEEGIPNHQVRRFQIMAADNPANITCRVI